MPDPVIDSNPVEDPIPDNDPIPDFDLNPDHDNFTDDDNEEQVIFQFASSPGRDSSSTGQDLPASFDSAASRRPLTQDLVPEVVLREGSPLPLVPPSQVCNI